MPEIGRPMLSSMPWSSLGGISRRIALSIRSISPALSSMRVPVLARRCKRNTDRQANVVEYALEFSGRNLTADRALDPVDQPGAFFDAGAGAGPDVQAQYSCI